MEALPEESAGRGQGIMTTAFATGSFLGPSLGGFIIDYIHWRGVFLLLVPIGLAASALAFFTGRNSETSLSPQPTTPRPPVDVPGSGLLIAATVTLIALLDRRILEILGGTGQIGLFMAFTGFVIGFLLREAHTPSPIVNLSLFKIRMFACSSVSLLLASVTWGITLFIIPFYLQGVLHISPWFMGLLFMTPPFFTLTLSPSIGYLSDRVGPRLPATVGLAFLTLSLALGITLRPDSSWLLPGLILALGIH